LEIRVLQQPHTQIFQKEVSIPRAGIEDPKGKLTEIKNLNNI